MTLISNDSGVQYTRNINMEFDEYMQIFIIISSFFGLLLAGFTFVFQIKHPKSR